MALAVRRPPAGGLVGRASRLAQKQAKRPRAAKGTWRGSLWSLLVAVDFFLVSNPLVFIPVFEQSLDNAVWITALFGITQVVWVRVPAVPWDVLIFLAFCALSAAWSISSPVTWQAVELYAWITLIALFIGANVTLAVLVDGLAWAGVLIVAASYYARRELIPGALLQDHIGYMAGVGTNRNILAYTLVLCLAAVVSAMPRSSSLWVVRGTCTGVILLGIYLSGSGTGFVATAAVLAVALLLVSWERVGTRLTRPAARGLALGLGGFVLLAVVEFDRLTSLLGRDTELSGRVPFWAGVIEVVRANDGVLWGFGWGAVWPHPWQVAPPNTIADQMFVAGGQLLVHGHNSILDLFPQVGLVGVALALIILGRILSRALVARRGETTRYELAFSRFLILGLVAQVAFGSTEPLVTIPVGWFCLVLLAQIRPDPTRGSRPLGRSTGETFVASIDG